MTIEVNDRLSSACDKKNVYFKSKMVYDLLPFHVKQRKH